MHVTLSESFVWNDCVQYLLPFTVLSVPPGGLRSACRGVDQTDHGPFNITRMPHAGGASIECSSQNIRRY